MNQYVKSLLCIFAISELLALIGLALNYIFECGSAASQNQTAGSSAEPLVLDGGYTYVDNDKLLEVISGIWVSADDRFKLTIKEDSSISIALDESVMLNDVLEFTYLQPGYVECTEFEISCWDLTNQDGTTLGVIRFLRYESAGRMEEGGSISMRLEDAEGNCETIVFEKTLAD